MLLLVRKLTIIYIWYVWIQHIMFYTSTIPSQCLGAYINCVVWWALLSVVLSVYQNLFFYRYMVVICNACVAQTHTALTTKRWCRRSFCAAAAVAAAVICVVNVDALANTIAVSVCVVLCMDAWIFYSSANLPSKQMHNTPHAVFDEPRKLAVGRAPHKIQARIIVDSAISVCMLCSVVRSKCMSFHSRGYASVVLTGKWYTHTHTNLPYTFLLSMSFAPFGFT